jgi:hypothetical protein
VAEWLRSGLQIRAPRFDSGRRLHSMCKHTNDFGVQSQAIDTTQALEQGGKRGGSFPTRQLGTLHALFCRLVGVAFIISPVLYVSLAFPELTHQVRLVMLLLIIGGPDG